MNVLIVSYEFPPDIGGAGVVAHDIAANLDTNRFHTTVITRYNKNRIQNNKFTCQQVKSVPKLYPFLFYIKLLSLGIDYFDAIILNDIAGFLFACYFLPKKYYKKCILYSHGGEIDELFISRSILNRLLNFSNKYIKLAKCCHKIIIVSDHYKKKYVDYFNIPLITAKTILVYNGIDTTLFNPSPIDIKKRHGLPENAIILLSVSRILEVKGYMDMLTIFSDINKKSGNFHWIIIGDGPYISALTNEINKLNLSEKITCINRINRNKLKDYYSSADVFWLLSNLSECLPLVYLEAASCGIPSIGRNAYGMRETIADNISGLLVNNDHECYTILLNQTFRKLSKAKILEFANTFSIQNLTKQIEVILSSI